MFGWWKNLKLQTEKEKLEREWAEDSIRNGAKTTDDVIIGRLPFPNILVSDMQLLRKTNYQEAVSKIRNAVKNYRPFPHRNYSESEVIVITEELIDLYWLSEISKEILSEFGDAEYQNENSLENFINRCFIHSRNRGFILGTCDLNAEEHKKYLTKKWTKDFREALINRLEKRIRSLRKSN